MTRLLTAIIAATHIVSAKAAILFSGGTIIAWSEATHSLQVLRNHSLLVEDNTIKSIFPGTIPNGTLPSPLQIINSTNDILTPGFIDTHRHNWQTSLKTVGSNITLIDYFPNFGSPGAPSTTFSPEDVYISQLAGVYEAINAGVTTIVDSAHASWSEEHALAALNASFESGVRGVWAFYFGDSVSTGWKFDEQVTFFRNATKDERWGSSATEIGISYDAFDGGNQTQTQIVLDLAREYNVSLLTTHANGGVYGAANFPTLLQNLDFLNQSIPIIFAHASYITAADASLLRKHNHYISITPESEMHYGHLHPNSHLILDQASLGIDTHFTFSTDILTQARLWLQNVRKILYTEMIDRQHVPAKNPMSATQAFLLATRNGALALRRDDVGVLAVGKKADILVWNGRSPALLGWRDPVAAVMLHASVGDIKHVVVDGVVKKRDGVLSVEGYEDVQERFLRSAERIQDTYENGPVTISQGDYSPGIPFERPLEADVLRGNGTGYGELFLKA